jgi:hypothetical protein
MLKTPRILNSVKAASLRRFVVLLATSPSDKIPDDDLHRFFLILHSITSSFHFLEHLGALIDCHLLNPPTDEARETLARRRTELRVSIVNLLKKWTNFHGLFIGAKTIKGIEDILRMLLDDPVIERFARSILQSLPSLGYGIKTGIQPEPSTLPLIPDPQVIFQPELTILDPEPEEVARQITLMFHRVFQTVHSREFMVGLSSQKPSHHTPTLQQFFGYGFSLTRLVLATIIRASDKSAAALRILEIAEHCDRLCNFHAVACIVKGLGRDELAGLGIYGRLRALIERCGVNCNSRDVYVELVRSNFESWEATIPNLAAELEMGKADTTPPFSDGLINWERRWTVSERIVMLYRFQNKPYSFWDVLEIQSVIEAGPQMSEKENAHGLEGIRTDWRK